MKTSSQFEVSLAVGTERIASHLGIYPYLTKNEPLGEAKYSLNRNK